MNHVLSPSEAWALSDSATPFVCEVRFGVRASAWIRLGGELDIVSAPHLKQVLGQAMGAAVLVVLDLRDLTFMDSAGARVIGEAQERSRRTARRLVIVRGPHQIERLLEIVGLTDRLAIIDLKPALVSVPAVAGLPRDERGPV